MDEDDALTLPLDVLLQNDTDVDGDSLAISNVIAPTSVIAPANGALTIGANGTFTFTPNAGFNGMESFTYEVTDGNGGSATATVNITVNSINDDPVAGNDAFSTDEDTAYSATLGLDDLLQNDSDLDGDTLAVNTCLLYTSPSPRDKRQSRMPSSA